MKSSTLPTPSAASSSRSSMCSKSTAAPPTVIGCSAPRRGAAVGVPLEEDVDEGEEPVPRDAHRRAERDGDHPRERDEDLHRGDDDDRRSRSSSTRQRRRRALPIQPVSGKCSARVLAGRRSSRRQRVLQRRAAGRMQMVDAEDGQLDVVGLPEGRAEEPRAAAALAGGRRGWFFCRITMSTTIPTKPAQAKNSVTHSYRKKWPISGSAKSGSTSWPNALTQGEEQDPEADHREPVRHRHDRQPRHPGVARGTRAAASPSGRPCRRCGRSGWPSRNTERNCRMTRANRAIPTRATTPQTTRARRSRAQTLAGSLLTVSACRM